MKDEYYTITRDGTYEPNESIVDLADEYIIKAHRAYERVWLISKKNKLRLVKELARRNLDDVMHNLTYGSWVCVSKSETKRKPVREALKAAMKSVDTVTGVEYKLSRLYRKILF